MKTGLSIFPEVFNIDGKMLNLAKIRKTFSENN